MSIEVARLGRIRPCTRPLSRDRSPRRRLRRPAAMNRSELVRLPCRSVATRLVEGGRPHTDRMFRRIPTEAGDDVVPAMGYFAYADHHRSTRFYRQSITRSGPRAVVRHECDGVICSQATMVCARGILAVVSTKLVRWGAAAPSDRGSARDRLLDAAERCLESCGVVGTTMEDIGRTAGVSRATVYRYFPIGRR